MSWGNIALIHQHAKSVTLQPLLLDLQPEVRMPQLKPEIHLLNIKMDREAFWVTESKLKVVLTASSGSGTSRSVITQTSLWSRLRHFSGCQATLQPTLPLIISRASHTNEIQINTATLFATPPAHGCYENSSDIQPIAPWVLFQNPSRLLCNNPLFKILSSDKNWTHRQQMPLIFVYLHTFDNGQVPG